MSIKKRPMIKLYTYGDSFTAGDGTRVPLVKDDGKTQIDVPNPLKFKFWVDIVGKNLNANVVNRGIGGLSNNIVFMKFLADLDKFKEGDTILYSIGWTERTDFIVDKATRESLEPVNINGDITRPTYCQTISNNFENIYPPDRFKHRLTELYGRETEDLSIAMLNFNRNYKVPNNNLIKVEDTLRVKLVTDYLETKGIKCHIWNLVEIVGDFSSIEEETKGKIKDGHWGWAGGHKFAKHITKAIKNG